MAHLNTSLGCPLSGDVSRKKGTTRDRLALRRDAPVPPAALSVTPPTNPPARVSAVVCFFRNFSSGFIPAGMVGLRGGGGGGGGVMQRETEQRWGATSYSPPQVGEDRCTGGGGFGRASRS